MVPSVLTKTLMKGISTQEALELRSQLGGTDDERTHRLLRPILDAHVQKRSKAGLRPFDLTPDEHVAKLQMSNNMYSPAEEGTRPPAMVEAASGAWMPENAYKSGANIAGLADRLGIPSSEVAEAYPAFRAQFAAEVMGLDSDPGDDGLFNYFNEETEMAVEDLDTTYNLRQQGLKDALDKGSETKWAAGFNEYMEGQTLKYGDRPGKRAMHEKTYREGFQVMRRKTQGLRKVTQTVIEELRKPEGQLVEAPVSQTISKDTLAKLGSLSKEDLELVMHMVAGEAEQGEIETGAFQDMATAVIRGFTGMFGEEGSIDLGGKERAVTRAMKALKSQEPIILTRAPKEGEDILSLLVPWGLTDFAQRSKLQIMGQGMAVAQAEAARVEATAEQRAEIKKRLKAFPKEIKIIRDLRSIAQQAINPHTPGSNWRGWSMENIILPALSMPGTMAAAATPVDMYVAQSDENSQKFRDAGYGWEESIELGNIAGAGTMLIELGQMAVLGGGGRILAGAAHLTKKKAAGHFAIGYLGEVAQEYAQESVGVLLSLTSQAIADEAGKVPEATTKLFKGLKDSLFPIALQMIPVGLIGGGVATYKDFKLGAERYLRDVNMLAAILPRDVVDGIVTLAETDPQAAEKKLQGHFEKGDLLDKPDYTEVTKKHDEAEAAMASLGFSAKHIGEGEQVEVTYMEDGKEVTQVVENSEAAQALWSTVWNEAQEVVKKTAAAASRKAEAEKMKVTAQFKGRDTTNLRDVVFKNVDDHDIFKVIKDMQAGVSVFKIPQESFDKMSAADDAGLNPQEFAIKVGKMIDEAAEGVVVEAPSFTTPAKTEANAPSVVTPEETVNKVAASVKAVPGVSVKVVTEENVKEGARKGSRVRIDPKTNELTAVFTKEDLSGANDDPSLIIDEELTHLSEMVGAREEWEASDKSESFPGFLTKRAKERAVSIDKDLKKLPKAKRQEVARALVESIRLYTRGGSDVKNSAAKFKRLEAAADSGSVSTVLLAAREAGSFGSESSIYSEWIRQMDQIRRTDTTTEASDSGDVAARFKEFITAVKEAIKDALGWVKRGQKILDMPGTVRKDLEAIAAQREKLTETTPDTATKPEASPETDKAKYGPPGGQTKPPPKAGLKTPTKSTGPSAPDISHLISRGFTTANNAFVDEQRKAMGKEPIMSAISDAVMDEKVEFKKAAKLNHDGKAGHDLVEGILAEPKALQPAETYLLVHELAMRSHRRDVAAAELNNLDVPHLREARERALETADGELARVQEAVVASGRPAGQSFKARQLIINDQFSVVSLKLHWTSFANNGVAMTRAQEKAVEIFSRKMQKLAQHVANATTNTELGNATFEQAEAWGAYLSEVSKEAGKSRTRATKMISGTLEASLVVKQIMTPWDMSPVGRQGIGVFLANPIVWAKAWVPMLKSVKSARHQYDIMQGIFEHPQYSQAKRDGVFISQSEVNPIGRGPQLERDEATLSKLPDKVWGVSASNRAFNTFLNVARFESYLVLTKNMDFTDPNSGKMIAEMVNVSTGRGGPRNMGDTSKAFGALFFSVRLQLARFQWALTPVSILRAPAEARGVMAKHFAKQLISIATFYGLFRLWKELTGTPDEEAEISTDMTSSDFGKVRFGNSSIDMLGGLTQPWVLAARLYQGKKANLFTGEHDDISFLKAVGQYQRTKLSPVIGGVVNVFEGRDPIYAPTGPLDWARGPFWMTELTGAKFPAAVASWVQPMILDEIREALIQEGVPKGSALGLMAFFGFGIQSFDRNGKPPKKGRGGFNEVREEYGGNIGLLKEFGTQGLEELNKLFTSEEEVGPSAIPHRGSP